MLGITQKELLDSIDSQTKFNIVCKSKNIDKDTLTLQIIEKIKKSDIDDKNALIGETEIIRYGDVIGVSNDLFIDETLLLTKKEAINYFKNEYGDNTESELKYVWIELNNKEKEMIKIALQCGLKEIKIKDM